MFLSCTSVGTGSYNISSISLSTFSLLAYTDHTATTIWNQRVKPDKELADVVSPLPVLPQKSKLADIPNDSELFIANFFLWTKGRRVRF